MRWPGGVGHDAIGRWPFRSARLVGARDARDVVLRRPRDLKPKETGLEGGPRVSLRSSHYTLPGSLLTQISRNGKKWHSHGFSFEIVWMKKHF